MSANNTRESRPGSLSFSTAASEINVVLDNEIMTAEQLLDELMGAMTNVELKENWDYIKQNWDLEEFV